MPTAASASSCALSEARSTALPCHHHRVQGFVSAVIAGHRRPPSCCAVDFDPGWRSGEERERGCERDYASAGDDFELHRASILVLSERLGRPAGLGHPLVSCSPTRRPTGRAPIATAPIARHHQNVENADALSRPRPSPPTERRGRRGARRINRAAAKPGRGARHVRRPNQATAATSGTRRRRCPARRSRVPD